MRSRLKKIHIMRVETIIYLYLLLTKFIQPDRHETHVKIVRKLLFRIELMINKTKEIHEWC